MKNLLESISNNAILEKVINILSDLPDDDIQSFDIQKKSMDNLVNVKEQLDRKKIKQDLLTSISLYQDTAYCKNFPTNLINELNNPDNFRKYAGLIKVRYKDVLENLIYIAIDQLGYDGNLNWIDTSDITDMSDLFYDNKIFNGHIELWDVSKVEDFSMMFYNANNFNQNISQWDMSNAINVSGMFYNAYNFNQPLNSWKLYNAQYMGSMFRRAMRFNQPLDNWYVNNVTDMYYMFSGAEKFNQPIGNWNVAKVTNMRGMFCEAYSFKQDISNWKLNSKCSTYQMYAVCNIPNEFKAISNYTVNENINILSDIDDGDDLHNIIITTKNMNNKRSYVDILRDRMLKVLNGVINYDGLINDIYSTPHLPDGVVQELNNQNNFETYSKLYQVNDYVELQSVISIFQDDLGQDGNYNWIDTSKVTSFEYLFAETTFNGHIELWDTSNVVDMTAVFQNNTDFNQDISNWDTSNVTTMKAMFRGAESFNQPIGKWNTSNVTNMEELFFLANTFNKPLNTWDVSKVTTMQQMFKYAYKFNQPLDKWNTSSLITTESMFYASEFNKPINTWDMSNVKDMSFMFAFAKKFNKPLNNWNTSSVNCMKSMFAFSKKFNQNINDWDVSNVTDMRGMFLHATMFNKSINKWDIKKVTTFNQMFSQSVCNPDNYAQLYDKNELFNQTTIYSRYPK